MRFKLLLAVLLCVCAIPAYGQFKASMQGTVTDPQGNAVVGAQVSLIDQGTEVNYHAVTNDQGYYRINELPPGSYTVIVDAPGFKKTASRDVVVEAEQPRGF